MPVLLEISAIIVASLKKSILSGFLMKYSSEMTFNRDYNESWKGLRYDKGQSASNCNKP